MEIVLGLMEVCTPTSLNQMKGFFKGTVELNINALDLKSLNSVFQKINYQPANFPQKS